MSGGVCSVNAWCSRSVDIVHVVADQEHSDHAVPRYGYRTELVWRFVVPTMHARTVRLYRFRVDLHVDLVVKHGVLWADQRQWQCFYS